MLDPEIRAESFLSISVPPSQIISSDNADGPPPALRERAAAPHRGTRSAGTPQTSRQTPRQTPQQASSRRLSRRR
ncbi:hypothetical protein GCM10010505_32710 [Kitasatospora aburaviensis]